MNDEPIDLSKWMKATRVAQLLRIHTNTMLRWIIEGRFADPRKVCGRWYVRVEEVEALFVAPRQEPARQPIQKQPKTSAWAKEVLARTRM